MPIGSLCPFCSLLSFLKKTSYLLFGFHLFCLLPTLFLLTRPLSITYTITPWFIKRDLVSLLNSAGVRKYYHIPQVLNLKFTYLCAFKKFLQTFAFLLFEENIQLRKEKVRNFLMGYYQGYGQTSCGGMNGKSCRIVLDWHFI